MEEAGGSPAPPTPAPPPPLLLMRRWALLPDGGTGAAAEEEAVAAMARLRLALATSSQGRSCGRCISATAASIAAGETLSCLRREGGVCEMCALSLNRATSHGKGNNAHS